MPGPHCVRALQFDAKRAIGFHGADFSLVVWPPVPRQLVGALADIPPDTVVPRGAVHSGHRHHRGDMLHRLCAVHLLLLLPPQGDLGPRP